MKSDIIKITTLRCNYYLYLYTGYKFIETHEEIGVERESWIYEELAVRHFNRRFAPVFMGFSIKELLAEKPFRKVANINNHVHKCCCLGEIAL